MPDTDSLQSEIILQTNLYLSHNFEQNENKHKIQYDANTDLNKLFY